MGRRSQDIGSSESGVGLDDLCLEAHLIYIANRLLLSLLITFSITAHTDILPAIATDTSSDYLLSKS